LTNIYNRRYFLRKMEETILQINQENSKEIFCIAMVDVDNFKQINDSYNHQYGDFVLQKITCCILNQLHHEDLFARWGGDEFVICLNDTKKDEAKIKLEKMKKQINRIQLPDHKRVSVSIGIAEYEEEETIDALIETADTLLYLSKEQGKNCIC